MSSGVDDKQAGDFIPHRELKDYASEQVDVLQAVNTVAGTLYRGLGLDWYQVIAAAMFEVPYEEVTQTQRSNAKFRYFNATNWALQDKGML
jgi:hypothetical protein